MLVGLVDPNADGGIVVVDAHEVAPALLELGEGGAHVELVAVGAKLFEALANYHLRTHGFWSGKGKFIPRD